MTESHEPDPWEAARERQKEEVAAIFAKREAKPVEDRRREFRLSRRNSKLVLAVIAVVGLVAVIVVPSMRDDDKRQRATEAAKLRRLAATERARIIREQKPHFATGPAKRPEEDVLAYRKRLLAAGGDVIVADARQRMQAGTITGPVKGSECAPHPATQGRRDLEADPSVPKGRYECIAYERKFPLSELQGKARTGVIGASYWLVVDYRNAEYAYCRIIPKPGEAGKALAFVRVQPVCSDPLD